jgi:DnaJ family protein C protein 28
MMIKFGRSLDEQIRRAIKNGEFENLPGKGRPLDLSENPYADPIWSMAYKMLKSGGHTLPWIETRQIIEKGIAVARKSLARTWDWRTASLEKGHSLHLIEEELQRAIQIFQAKVVDLNKQIDDYNLEIPSTQFRKRKLDFEKEIERITTQSN